MASPNHNPKLPILSISYLSRFCPSLFGSMSPVQRSVQVGERFHGQGISPAARRSATAASSETAYRSPAAAASGTMSGWNTVAFGAAKSDRFELTSTRELGYPAAASRVLSRRAWPRM